METSLARTKWGFVSETDCWYCGEISDQLQNKHLLSYRYIKCIRYWRWIFCLGLWLHMEQAEGGSWWDHGTWTSVITYLSWQINSTLVSSWPARYCRLHSSQTLWPGCLLMNCSYWFGHYNQADGQALEVNALGIRNLATIQNIVTALDLEMCRNFRLNCIGLVFSTLRNCSGQEEGVRERRACQPSQGLFQESNFYMRSYLTLVYSFKYPDTAVDLITRALLLGSSDSVQCFTLLYY